MLPDSKPNNPNTLPSSSTRKSLSYLNDYFINSNQKLVAWLYLIGIILCVIASVGLMVGLTWWSAGFFPILMAKAIVPFLISIGQFAGMVTGLVFMSVLKNYLIEKLSIRWLNWLTERILMRYLKYQNYLAAENNPHMLRNISQCIQEDIPKFVGLTLRLGSGLLKSILSLGAFSSTLWIVGGALAFVALGLNIVIPGYLLWVALIVAIIASVSTHFIAKSLAKKNQISEDAEAELRKGTEEVRKNAGNVAQENAEEFHLKYLHEKLSQVKSASNQKLVTQSRLIGFQDFYTNLSMILPDLIAAPLFFADLIELSQLMQIGMAFGEVSNALSFIVNSYEDIAKCTAAVNRIANIEQGFDEHEALIKANQSAVEQNLKANQHPSSIIIIPGTMRKPGKDKRKEENEGAINFKNITVKKNPWVYHADGVSLMTMAVVPMSTIKFDQDAIILVKSRLYYVNVTSKTITEISKNETNALNYEENYKMLVESCTVSRQPASERALAVITSLTGRIRTDIIFTQFKFKLKQGEDTVLIGAPGVGKSSIFKLISQNRIYGQGKITLPFGKTLCFVPQRPTITDAISLRGLLAYPSPDDAYSDAAYEEALLSVGIDRTVFNHHLDHTCAWSSILSGGEQQQIAVARAVLRNPDVLFLDEATSAVPKDVEEKIYTGLKKKLPNATFFSIAHKETVYKFHKKVVRLDVDAVSKVASVEEIKLGIG